MLYRAAPLLFNRLERQSGLVRCASADADDDDDGEHQVSAAAAPSVPPVSPKGQPREEALPTKQKLSVSGLPGGPFWAHVGAFTSPKVVPVLPAQ